MESLIAEVNSQAAPPESTNQKQEMKEEEKQAVQVSVEPFPVVKRKFVRGDLDEGAEGN
jgi:hypothetical protein